VISEFPTDPNFPFALTTGNIIVSADSLDSNQKEFLALKSPTSDIYKFQIEVEVPDYVSSYSFGISQIFIDQLTTFQHNDTISTNWGVNNDIQVGIMELTLNTIIDDPMFVIDNLDSSFDGFQFPIYSNGEPYDMLLMVDSQNNDNLDIEGFNMEYALVLASDDDTYINANGFISAMLGGPQSYVVHSIGEPFNISVYSPETQSTPTSSTSSSISGGSFGLILGSGTLMVVIILGRRKFVIKD